MAILASLIAGLASGETAAALQRAKTAAIVYALAALVFAIGVGFLIAAAFIWSERHFGALETALGFGIGFLVVAGLILLVYRLAAVSRKRRRVDRRKADLTALGITAAAAVLPALSRGKSGLGMVLGPLAALAAYAIYRENTRPPGEDGKP